MDVTYMVNSFRRRIDTKDIYKYFGASLGVYAAFAVMLLLKSTLAFDVYMSALVPLIVFTAGVYCYCSYRNSSMPLAFVTITLNTIGFTLMCIISPEGIVLKHVIAMVGAIVIFAFYRIFTAKFNPYALMIVIGVVSTVIYVILLLPPGAS